MLGEGPAMSTVYATRGRSNHTADTFLQSFDGKQIEVVVNTRSAPYSRYAPQFDREIIEQYSGASRNKYLFLGKELGGRPANSDYYDASGRVVYSRITRDPEFVDRNRAPGTRNGSVSRRPGVRRGRSPLNVIDGY